VGVLTTPADNKGVIHFTLAVAEDSIQQKAVVYDKKGDAHYDTISAFIKACARLMKKARFIGWRKCSMPEKTFVSSRAGS